MIFHDMDLERNLSFDKRLSEIGSFRRGEVIEIILELPLRFFRRVLGVGDGDVNGSPVGAVKDAGGTDVEENDGVSGTEVLLDRPLDGVGTLVAEVDGDGDPTLSSGGGGGGGGWC